MVNEQIMVDTVKRMIEAGIDDETIISTLTEAGLSSEESINIIQQVKAPAVKKEDTPVSPQSEEVSMLRNVIEATAQTQEIQSESTTNKLSEHEEKIAQVDNKIESIKSVISSSKQKDDGTISYRVGELEKKLEEVSASSKAQLDLLKKVLETNRKILTELESKK